MEENLYLAKVTTKDCELIFKWANDPDTRINSFNKDNITWEVHEKWFNNKIISCDNYYILKSYEENIGQIRLDNKESDNVISYSIDPRYRGKGYGKKIIELLEEKLILNNERKVITAYVKPENVISAGIFESLHYKKIELNDYYKFEKKIGDDFE